MSINQNTQNPATEVDGHSAIENEIPAYRAINTKAVFALICGIIGILSFASWMFLAAAVLGVLLGYFASREIKRFPDRFTGLGLAQAGMGLGLIFGLTSVSLEVVQGVVRSTLAKNFALEYEQALKKKSFEQLAWYSQPAGYRKDLTPEKLVADIKQKAAGSPMMEQQFSGIKEVAAALAVPGTDVHYEGIEYHDVQGLNLVAGAVYEIHNPNAAKPEEKERLLLANLKAAKSDKGVWEWIVEDVRFPFNRGSYVPAEKGVDDGHGHAH